VESFGPLFDPVWYLGKNRDVAAALFISPKTVDANLSRIYRKLGIRSRAELGRRMGKPG